MELKNTSDMMNSDNYKVRFTAEYWQTKIRHEKLRRMCDSYEKGTLSFTPKCSLDLLKKQLSAMDNYLQCLEERAEIEGIELFD